MILYHGSKAIVGSPEIRIPKYNKDFYFGFYCTLYPEQAIRWAIRFGGTGYLNEYEYMPNETLKTKRFPEMSKERPSFMLMAKKENPNPRLGDRNNDWNSQEDIMPITEGLEWTFDTVSARYEKFRPGYPDDLYKTLFNYISIDGSSAVVEIGIGGGQATLPFLEKG